MSRSAIQFARFDPVGMVVLHDQTLVVDTASFDVLNIPSSYKHLMAIAHLRGTEAADQTDIRIRFNNDSSNIYQGHYLFTTIGAASGITAANPATYGLIGLTSAASGTAGDAGNTEILIADYASAIFHKQCNCDSYYARNTDTVQTHGGAHWPSTAPINRITLLPGSGNWKAGSYLTMYGLGGAPAAPDLTAEHLLNYMFAR